MAQAQAILETLRSQIDLTDYKKLHWEGWFDDYLDIVIGNPAVTPHGLPAPVRHDPQPRHRGRVRNKEKLARYKFFTEFAAKHGDSASTAWTRPLIAIGQRLQDPLHLGYGTERRRVILLHGPVGSAQESTIARLLKRGAGRVLP